MSNIVSAGSVENNGFGLKKCFVIQSTESTSHTFVVKCQWYCGRTCIVCKFVSSVCVCLAVGFMTCIFVVYGVLSLKNTTLM